MIRYNKRYLCTPFYVIICLLLISPNFIQPATAAPSNTYIISYSTSNGGSSSFTTPTGTINYTSNGPIQISATPGSGYVFSSWSASPGNSVSFSSASSASTNATINGNGTITAIFTQITYQVGFATSGSGSTNPSGAHAYAAGQQIQLNATADSGYVFSSWSASPGNSVSFSSASSASTMATINGNGTITAIFTQITYQVGFATSGSGSTNPSGAHAYAAGQQIQLNATADSGYVFSSWSASPGNSVSFSSASSASTMATINGNGIITASFSQNSYSLSTTVIGKGSVVTNPNQTSYHYGDTVVLTATSASGWVFSGWSGDLSSLGNPSTVTIIKDMSVTATFTQSSYSASVTVLPSSGGVVTANATAPYYYGDVIVFTASPNPGYSFDGWNGDGTGAGVIRTVTITRNMAITASFSQVTYDIVFATSYGGTTSPSGAQTYNASQQVLISAIAANGYTFLSWSATPSESISFTDTSSASTTATINGVATITAAFTQNTQTAKPTPSSTPSPTSSTSPSPTPKASPSPTSIPSSITIPVSTDNNSTINLIAKGGITTSQVISANIATDQSNTTTTLSLVIVAQTGSNGFGNITIPKNAIRSGITPSVYINSQVTPTQGYTQDSKNYYVWYTTYYGTYELQIIFGSRSPTAQFPIWEIIVIVIVAILAVLTVAFVLPGK